MVLHLPDTILAYTDYTANIANIAHNTEDTDGITTKSYTYDFDVIGHDHNLLYAESWNCYKTLHWNMKSVAVFCDYNLKLYKM